MAILTFPSLPADTLKFDPGSYIGKYMNVFGAVTAGPGVIEALSEFRFFTGPPDYDRGRQSVEVEVSGTFSYGDLATVSGTATSLAVSVDGTDIMTVTGFSADAGPLWAAMLGGGTPMKYVLGGDDTITGTNGADKLHGHAGDDVIDGLNGFNTLSGGTGNDTLTGGIRYDLIRGGRGNDSIDGGAGNDTIYGGGGDDMVIGGDGGDFMRGNNGADMLRGGAGNDTIYAGNGNDSVEGNEGADRLYGNGGDDMLSGGLGNDRIDAGRGDDTLTGGGGVDRFIFNRFSAEGKSGQNTITDFEATDRIILGRVIDASALVVAQAGDDVTIALSDNLVTVLDATLADVQDAIETSFYNYFAF